jgi:nudix-type nucleoside diphosphatase (YffH/AdpP family)
MPKFSILKETRILDSYTKVDEAEIQHNENFKKFFRQKVVRPDAVVGLLYNTDSDTVVLVKQYRYPIHNEKNSGFIYEAIAGCVDKNENPTKCFIRECYEETGYLIPETNVEYCFSAYVSPGYTTEKLHYFLATVKNSDKKSSGGGLESENEFIEVCEIPYLIFKGMMDGNIQDSKTKLLAFEAHYRKLFDKK